ncbi:dipeptide/oligopeptide/nickel ABC transporter permease/ATP-binding protein [Lipingzhangella sp. LS1_29]|uniref:Dipeptide/oligopeptide/nickel ABC transporter permease/ATP-binding protein n=1 Tax=Lipingzhangella rawalii TaxID=2055835 RepID=A0ABU2H8G7_9ACTN|nr:dipeptide/oligopeptide/nickel ABC transporter permease/ATP-binding protein [Lipingzhangella rawalii]MDS1271130.1 dipeptide/oligopeptide/nickel ABC transporter permease/ATP-binding protein [Lipingzhangella rawalii]
MSGTATSATTPATFLRRIIGNVQALLSLLVLLVILTLVALAPLVAGPDPTSADLSSAFGGPEPGHPLGFDSSGRDMWSRLLHGGQLTLGGAALALAVALTLGVPTGLAAGFYGGWFDLVSGWWVNLIMALPAMVVLLASRAVLGSTVWVLMVVLGILVSPSFFRLVRGTVANMRAEPYVDAARVFGLRDSRIIARHVLIVVRAPIIIQTALVAGLAINLQAGLEFLGIGSGDAPTWGAMLNEAFTNIHQNPLGMLWPGLALGLTSGSLVLLASALRDVLEDRDDQPHTSGPGEHPREADTPTTPRHAGARSELLSVRDLTITYPGADSRPNKVVRGVDLDVHPGEILGLVGESGSGKTQTAFSILGLLPAGGRVSRGSIRIGGTEVVGANERTLRRLRGRTVAYVPQEPMNNLDPSFTIGDHLVEPLCATARMPRSAAWKYARELLHQVEITDPDRILRSYPHQISGGMAQRVLIAGALSCSAELVIADEPTTALDVTVQAEVLGLLRRLRASRGMAVLLVSHDLGVVADLCDRVAVLHRGRIVEVGTTEQVLTAPESTHAQELRNAVLDDVPARQPWSPREVDAQ